MKSKFVGRSEFVKALKRNSSDAQKLAIYVDGGVMTACTRKLCWRYCYFGIADLEQMKTITSNLNLDWKIMEL